MTASRFAQGVAVARDPATPVTAVPSGGMHWDGWGDAPVPPPRPPEWRTPPAWYDPPAEPPPRRRVLRWAVGVVMLVGLAGLVSIVGLLAIVRTQAPQAPRTGPSAARPGVAAPTLPGLPADESAPPEASAAPSAAAAPTDTAAIIAATNRSVVNITSTLGLRNARAAGTGVILDGSGLVLTNNHVIAGATSISGVAVANGRTFTASVVGYDRSRDVAVIRLAGASGLPRLGVADSAQVRVGDPIVAVGNAGGAGGTPDAVTGKVTALNRSITAQEPDGGSSKLNGLIQVAADIRPGDSGGPLVDRTGRLIGINTAASLEPGSQEPAGTGFAIPSNTAIAIAQRIRAGQASDTVHIGPTALLGVQATDGDARRPGTAVSGVIAGSPAERAGLTQGDVIRTVDGRAVDSASALTAAVDAFHPGDTVRITWLDRSGRQRAADVRLATGPAG